MTRKYVAFDIEIAKDVPGKDFQWKPHRPLGMTRIASQSTDCDEPKIWLTRTESGTPAPKMSQTDVAAFVRFLASSLADSIIPLSWNGARFDFDILAEESGMGEECKALARKHVDMMFRNTHAPSESVVKFSFLPRSYASDNRNFA